MGAIIGYPTAALPQLEEETDLNLRLDEQSRCLTIWISKITKLARAKNPSESIQSEIQWVHGNLCWFGYICTI